MRCPSCGTQNEPDSRFCGGCGARLQGTLAPTHKIVPDPAVANIPVPQVPQRTPYQAPPVSQQVRQVSADQVSQRPPQMPPPMAAPAPNVNQIRPSQPVSSVSERPSQPQPVPRGSNAPGYAAPYATPPSGAGAVSARPRVSQDVSIALPRRNWGLIIVVLIFDLGLAAAGVYLLNEGLSANQPVAPPAQTGSASQGSTPAPKENVAAPAPAPEPVAAKPAVAPPPDTGSSGSGSVVVVEVSAKPAEPVVSDAKSGSGSAEAKPAETPPPPAARKQKPPRKPKTGPIDPYPDEEKPGPSGPAVGPPPPPEE